MRPQLEPGSIHPYAGRDIATLVDAQARALGSKPFLVWQPFAGEVQTWTYEQFARESLSLAAGLQVRGIKQGDFVLIHMDNSPEFLLSWTACARVGAVAVTTNTGSTGDEIGYFAHNSRAVAAITQPKYAGLIEGHCPDLAWLAVTPLNSDSSVDGRSSASYTSFQSLFGDAATFEPRAADPQAPLLVMYTSGTTSRPKGVLWTHGNGLWAAQASAFHESLTPADIHLAFLPLFHMNAMSCSTLASLWVGATVVLQPRFSASRFWEVALRYRCTWSSLIPFCINALRAQDVPEHHFRCWGLGISSPAIDEHFKVRTMGWWGMTETTTVGIVSSTLQENTPMSLGRPSPLYDIAIVSDNGTPVAAGETGNLLIRGVPGVSLFAEYLHNPEATEASFDVNGFFITGDRCTLLEDGSIRFADRNKDMLKVGGENVAASEIEKVILESGGVREVAVVAKPDPMLDQVPVAFIIPVDSQAGEDALTDRVLSACEEKLSAFKRPREVRIVSDLPRATMNKVAKNVLREQLKQEGG